MTWLWLGLGLGVLTLGAELLVRGAVGLASAMRVSPLVIGLTVVAFGTSAPEFVVSGQSALTGQPEIALGNVLGSNIFNILLILGISALIVPLRVDQQLIRLDVPLMIAVSVTVYGMSRDGKLDRLEGALLFTGLISYTVWSIIKSRQESNPEVVAEYSEEFPERPKATWGYILVQAVILIVGLAMLVQGANMFLDGAVKIARAWGFSELVIGLTLVAAGTSLPEVATSVMAALKGERDLAVGNVVGSNLFNLLGVLGFTSLIAPNGIPVSPAALSQDLPMMLIVALACLPVFLTGHVIHRWEGAIFLTFHILYTTFLVFTAQQWTAGVNMVTTILWVLVPLTVAAFAISLTREWRSPSGRETSA